jgi:exodeoxyribonuclease VII large subunit
VAALAGRLESLSPLGVLARGYSLTRTLDGRVVRDARSVRIADELVTRLAAGEVVSCVVEVRPGPEQTP